LAEGFCQLKVNHTQLDSLRGYTTTNNLSKGSEVEVRTKLLLFAETKWGHVYACYSLCVLSQWWCMRLDTSGDLRKIPDQSKCWKKATPRDCLRRDISCPEVRLDGGRHDSLDRPVSNLTLVLNVYTTQNN